MGRKSQIPNCDKKVHRGNIVSRACLPCLGVASLALRIGRACGGGGDAAVAVGALAKPYFIEEMPNEPRTKYKNLPRDLAPKTSQNQRAAFLPRPWGHGGIAPRAWFARFGQFGGPVLSDPPSTS